MFPVFQKSFTVLVHPGKARPSLSPGFLIPPFADFPLNGDFFSESSYFIESIKSPEKGGDQERPYCHLVNDP
jgi:hypothetical protein